MMAHAWLAVMRQPGGKNLPDPDLAELSVAEVRRLLEIVLPLPSNTPAFRPAWSRWRRAGANKHDAATIAVAVLFGPTLVSSVTDHHKSGCSTKPTPSTGCTHVMLPVLLRALFDRGIISSALGKVTSNDAQGEQCHD
jgi:hypothetical protein